MKNPIFLTIILFIVILPTTTSSPSAFAQEPIIINDSTPCFLEQNVTGIQMLKNCGIEEDFLAFALLPWQWITGGYFTMIIITILIFISYQKYHKAAYPIIIGTLYIPASYFLFTPQQFAFAILITFLAIGILFWFIFVRQTKDYSG